jgi:hypothetical protein
VVYPSRFNYETGVETGFFHMQTPSALSFTMERFWDEYPRVFDGSVTLKDILTGLENNIELSKLVYIKRVCCHPIAGQIILMPQHQIGTSTFLIDFQSPVCGEAILRDSLGRSQLVQLPECAS